jgi:hypothetical protein
MSSVGNDTQIQLPVYKVSARLVIVALLKIVKYWKPLTCPTRGDLYNIAMRKE